MNSPWAPTSREGKKGRNVEGKAAKRKGNHEPSPRCSHVCSGRTTGKLCTQRRSSPGKWQQHKKRELPPASNPALHRPSTDPKSEHSLWAGGMNTVAAVLPKKRPLRGAEALSHKERKSTGLLINQPADLWPQEV